MSDRLRGVRACVFDAYGTLFDVGSAVRRCAPALGIAPGPLATLWRDKQLQYTWLRAAQARHADFAAVTRDALAFTLQALEIDAAHADALLAAYMDLDAFDDVAAALARLGAAGLPLAILSNGTPAMLDRLVEHAGLAGVFDAVISVEEAGAFKPHRTVYQCAVDRLGLPGERIGFVSSNGWDAHAASASGMTVIWCNRGRQPPERLPGAPDAQIASLEELAPLLGR
jgi:2-haloacid dehalogenase